MASSWAYLEFDLNLKSYCAVLFPYLLQCLSPANEIQMSWNVCIDLCFARRSKDEPSC